MMQRLALLLLVAFVLPGCALSRSGGGASVPVAFSSPPALPQIVEAINANSQQVRQIHSSSVRLSIPRQLGSMNATMDYERSATPEQTPGRFRLAAEALGTRQLDLGSNDDKYWMWVKQSKPPTVFWGQHVDFYRSAAQQVLPMPPTWIIEALGVVTLDPAGMHQVYESPTDPGLVQVWSQLETPQGQLTRILEVDWRNALIVQQQIYDPDKRLLAVADLADFTHDPLQGVTLPKSIKIKLPPAGLAFNFAVDSYTINQPVSDPMALWSMPEINGHRYRDLANPADMQGIQLMGQTLGTYESQAVKAPVRPEQRSAWRNMPVFNFLR